MQPLLRLVTVLVGLLLLTTVPAAPASAFGGETFGCRIGPGGTTSFTPFCYNTRSASSYSVVFQVGNLSGSDYTFSWALTGDWPAQRDGCLSTTAFCGARVPNGDYVLQATVTYSQGGQSASQSATASVRRYCGSYPC